PRNTGLTSLMVRALALDPATPSTLYAVTAGGVFKSLNGGATWATSNSGLGGASVVNLAIDPATPSVLYARTNTYGVYRSTDGGGSWSPINAGLPVGMNGLDITALAIDPVTPTTLYAGIHYMTCVECTYYRVYKSTDGGDSWSYSSTGLSSQVKTLVIDPVTPTTLYAGGGGGYKSTNRGPPRRTS